MLLKGKPVADRIKEEVREDIKRIVESGAKAVPTLGILRVGERPDDVAYENMLVKSCDNTGIEVRTISYHDGISTRELTDAVNGLGNDSNINGILIFRPLPKHIDEKAVADALSPDKDVDCMSAMNMAKVFTGEKSAMAPSTPSAVMALLSHYEGDICGRHAVIVNRSPVLGKALSMLLLNENATVSICHSKTGNMAELTRRADIVITGIGKAGFFDSGYFSKDSVIVDVGINFDDSGMCGDVRTDEVEPHVRAITPVPGGVGSVTTAILLRNVLKRYMEQNGMGSSTR